MSKNLNGKDSRIREKTKEIFGKDKRQLMKVVFGMLGGETACYWYSR